MIHRRHIVSLLLCGFVSVNATTTEVSSRDEVYKKYFQQQEKIYQGLVNLGIPGARPLSIDKALADSVLATCPPEIHDIISDIEYRVFSTHKKNIIFHGPSGTGKSVLAQAIAIKSQAPCIFFNVGTISTEYKDSGIQNLNKIFKYAQELEEDIGQPCIIILDELEALTKKHVGTNNSESNILVSFWQELDRLCNSNVIAIGTMNNTEDVPDQIINRTAMIKIPLSNLKQRETILSFLKNKRANQYNLAYPEYLTATYLARKTKGFCNRDLENLVEQATRPVIKTPVLLDGSKKIVPGDNFNREMKKIQWQFVEKWQRTFYKHFRDPKITIPLVGIAAMLGVGYNTILNQRRGFDLQKKSMDMQLAHHKESMAVQTFHQKENIAMQEKSMAVQIAHHKESMTVQVDNQRENIALQKEAMKQAQEIFDKQTSVEHMIIQAKINSVKNWHEPDGRSIKIGDKGILVYAYDQGQKFL